jgi:hypothetical protein
MAAIYFDTDGSSTCSATGPCYRDPRYSVTFTTSGNDATDAPLHCTTNTIVMTAPPKKVENPAVTIPSPPTPVKALVKILDHHDRAAPRWLAPTTPRRQGRERGIGIKNYHKVEKYT